MKLAGIVMRTYGKWIPNNSLRLGYKPLNNRDAYFESINRLELRGFDAGEIYRDKSTPYMVEATGIEPVSANSLPLVLHV